MKNVSKYYFRMIYHFVYAFALGQCTYVGYDPECRVGYRVKLSKAKFKYCFLITRILSATGRLGSEHMASCLSGKSATDWAIQPERRIVYTNTYIGSCTCC